MAVQRGRVALQRTRRTTCMQRTSCNVILGWAHLYHICAGTCRLPGGRASMLMVMSEALACSHPCGWAQAWYPCRLGSPRIHPSAAQRSQASPCWKTSTTFGATPSSICPRRRFGRRLVSPHRCYTCTVRAAGAMLRVRSRAATSCAAHRRRARGRACDVRLAAPPRLPLFAAVKPRGPQRVRFLSRPTPEASHARTHARVPGRCGLSGSQAAEATETTTATSVALDPPEAATSAQDSATSAQDSATSAQDSCVPDASAASATAEAPADTHADDDDRDRTLVPSVRTAGPVLTRPSVLSV